MSEFISRSRKIFNRGFIPIEMKKRHVLLFLLLFLNFILVIYSIGLYAVVYGGFSFFPKSYASNQAELSLSVEGADSESPAVSIAYPDATTYTSHVTALNYTASDNQAIGSCWYSLNSGVTNTSVTCGDNVTSITSSEGSNTWRVYANDTSGNEGSDSVAFTVTISSGGGQTGGATGGGGGRGGYNPPLRPARAFLVSESEINVILALGEIVTREVTLENTGTSKLDINVSLSGFNDLVSADTNHLTISPGERKSVLLIMKSDSYGVYAGRLLFDAGGISKEVFIILNVQSSSSLFDVSLNLPQIYRTIHPGQTIKAFISLVQVGDNAEVDATANYYVKDFDGNTLLSESETFFVDRSKSFTREFDTSALPIGEYLLSLEFSYPGGFATSSARFEVSDKFEISPLYILIGVSVAAIIVAIISILRYKRLGKYTKYKRGR